MTSSNDHKALDLLDDVLKEKLHAARTKHFLYGVPSLWSSATGKPRTVQVHPYKYYHNVIRGIKRLKPRRPGAPTGGEWTKDAVIYNMFVRTTAAVDHNGNGKLDLPLNSDGFRETGTFLKAMAMLPYIKRLGATVVHLLPITSIGQDGNKGTLGSPYAIRNPYELDESLGEPGLGLDTKVQFKAFVEAAHRLGLRVIVEFVFRTAAKDGDWVKDHPEWFYWIKDELETRHPREVDEGKYGSPIFTQEELGRIHDDVRHGRLGELIPPHQQYRDFFTMPPRPGAVVMENGRWRGRTEEGVAVKIPGAFADWPPDDNQPPWGDVTYLRMYTNPAFNYIAYNTIRMYDSRLTTPEFVNRPLWDKIIGIIPYYQREFHIDGVMIDMGHALPMDLKSEMVRAARQQDPDFAFWDENFSITRKSRDEGYNAVFGYLWTDEHHPDRMQRFFHHLGGEGFPIPFFATPENHNTPRAAARPGGLAYARWALVMNAFLPAVPFLHSGFELGEEYPINTGLDFTHEQLEKLPSDRLPLFSEYGYHWTGEREFTRFVTRVLSVRRRHALLVTDSAPSTFRALQPQKGAALGYMRMGHPGTKTLAVLGSTNYTSSEEVEFRLETSRHQLSDALSGKRFPVHDGVVLLHLDAGQCVVLEW